MDYDAELERVASALETVPRKLSEKNVRMLGTAHHFETFEDELQDMEISEGRSGGTGMKRLSLSGSIVVLDLDFNRPNSIFAVSVSLSSGSASEATYSPMAPVNDPSGHILASLRRPRLNAFVEMLAFLSRCDRFSTKDVDCFKALDLVSEAVHFYVKNAGSAEAAQLQQLVINPPDRIGLGIKYLVTREQQYYVYLDVVPGSRKEFSLKKFDSIDCWLDSATCKWKNVDGDSAETDARAELALSLDPPVLVSDAWAAEVQAAVTNAHPQLDERMASSSYSVPRHPRFASRTASTDDFDARVGVLLPFHLVEVNQIPLRGPAQIAPVLGRLRQFALALQLVRSVLERGTEIPWTNEAADLNIGDALAMRDQPVHRRRIQLSISWASIENNALEITVAWLLSDLQLRIVLVPDGSPPTLMVTPPSLRLNVEDMHRLLSGGDLSLAISYAVSNIGQLHRRTSSRA